MRLLTQRGGILVLAFLRSPVLFFVPPCMPIGTDSNVDENRKTRYRGSAKNTAQLFTLFGFANLVLAGRRFTLPNTRVAS
jgi:hypothetical protein